VSALEAARASCLGTRATIVGTAGADLLRGTRKRDVIVALGGRDRVYGRGADDILCGGPGNDLLDGGPGRNRLNGGAGQDHCVGAVRAFGCETPLALAPAIAGLTLEGRRLSLREFRGRPVLVNVWSSWWSVCRSEAVAYAQFKKDHPELAYLGLNVVDRPTEAQAFVQRYGWDWPSIQDPRRDRARALGAEYQPHVIAIERAGRIVGRHTGAGQRADWERLAQLLR
jgi:Ca2+-binding RTX toxin-like protein